MLLSIEVICGELSIGGFERSKMSFFFSFNLQQYLKKCFPPNQCFVASLKIRDD